MESNNQLEVRVRVKVDLSISSILHLLEEKPIAAEDCKWCSCVVTGDVKLLTTADLHGKQMALQVIVERCNFRA